MGIESNWGSLAAGRVANITVLSPAAEVVQTFLAGRSTIA
jgi:N-acetylglucosamine-6-phosphate deacetylase